MNKVYKITIHDHYRENIKANILEWDILNITKNNNYILDLKNIQNQKTRRIHKSDLETINAERAYIFDLNKVDETVNEIIKLRRKRLNAKLIDIENKLNQLDTVEIDYSVKTLEDF